MRSLSLALGVTDLLSKASLNPSTGFSYTNEDTCYFYFKFVFLPVSIYNIGLEDCHSDVLQNNSSGYTMFMLELNYIKDKRNV